MRMKQISNYRIKNINSNNINSNRNSVSRSGDSVQPTFPTQFTNDESTIELFESHQKHKS